MKLYDKWIAKLKAGTRAQVDALLADYYAKETEVYKQILAEKAETFTGTAAEFGAKYGISDYEIGAFMEGINTSLAEPQDVKEIDLDTQLNFTIVWRELYKNMLKAKADWLYDLPEWDNFYNEDERREITREFRQSQQVHHVKVGRNDPCPCGSGKKYKNCCGME